LPTIYSCKKFISNNDVINMIAGSEKYEPLQERKEGRKKRKRNAVSSLPAFYF